MQLVSLNEKEFLYQSYFVGRMKRGCDTNRKHNGVPYTNTVLIALRSQCVDCGGKESGKKLLHERKHVEISFSKTNSYRGSTFHSLDA